VGLGLDQPSHWAVIAVVALLLFGYKKLPEMARSAGRSMRIFKTELKGMANDDDARAAGERDSQAEARKEVDPKSAELLAAEQKAATLRAELAAAEEEAAKLTSMDTSDVTDAAGTTGPAAAPARAVPADGVVPRAS
jgi:sec-independent protein translocase protein TatA